MSFLVTVYERRVGIGQYTWSTLGLGPANLTEQASSLPLLKERVIRKLKAWVKRAGARELLRLEQLPGLVLERHRVTLEVGRLSVPVSVPLIVEPRHTGMGEPLVIGYHPLFQDDFFIVDAARARPLQYRLFLEHLMRKAEDEEDLRELETRKDRLRTLVFDAEVPSLLERVGPARGAWWRDLRAERPPGEAAGQDDEAQAKSELDTIATDLSERATEGGLTLGLAREPLGLRLRTLAARGPVVLVGPPGVGKTTLVHRWVHERLEEDGYTIHRSLDQVRHAWALSGRRILAGMKHHGDWEARIAKVIDELVRRRGVLVVPDLPAWAALGRTRDSERNLADVMRGPLERREVTIIGEATAEAWARLEEDAPAFAAQFQVLRVDEPHPDELVRMLLAAGRALEDTGDTVFAPSVYRVVRAWSDVLHPGRAEPGRSLALLEQASHLEEWISEYELIEALTDRAGVPDDLLAHKVGTAGFVPRPMRELRAHVVGQDEATGAVLDMLQRVRTGLADPARPWGVFLLTGPTGTGKTELAKGVAEHLYGSAQRLLRIDLNQLTGPDAPARLIGDTFAPDGLLTRPVLDSPFQVVLLDELEKAHPSVLYLLLQLLDEGRLTDAAGRTADFRRAVILITSNLGAAAARAPLGFGDGPDAATRRNDTTRAVAAALPPELFNRLDAVLAFQPLGKDVALAIAQRQLERVGERAGLKDRHGSLACTPAALELVVRHGFDAEYGARTVKRWIESHVTDRIAAALVRVPGDSMKRVVVDAEGDALRIAVEALEPAPRTLALPWAWLLDFAPSDAEAALDQMIATLAALVPSQAERRDAPSTPSGPIAHADPVEADRLYWREQSKTIVAATLKTLRRIRSLKRSPIREIVAALSEASFVARVAADVDAPIHRATLRLTRPTRSKVRRLLPALAATYAAAPWEVEAWAARTPDGRTTTDRTTTKEPERVALRVSGFGVRLALEAEVGCQVLDLLADGLEVVRVELLPGETDGVAVTALVGEAPAGLAPQIRTLRHEAKNKQARPYEVEDHQMGHREDGHIVELAELTAWCLALGRSALRMPTSAPEALAPSGEGVAR